MRALTHKKLGAWQRAFDMLIELHTMCEHMNSRHFELLGKQLWHHGTLMLSEVALMCESVAPHDKIHHLFRARQALSRFETRIFVGRQLHVIDVDDEFLRQIERQRLDFERLYRQLERDIEAA